jgi:cell division protein ZapA (FtsZ GTPase activity inhibitor)
LNPYRKILEKASAKRVASKMEEFKRKFTVLRGLRQIIITELNVLRDLKSISTMFAKTSRLLEIKMWSGV